MWVGGGGEGQDKLPWTACPPPPQICITKWVGASKIIVLDSLPHPCKLAYETMRQRKKKLNYVYNWNISTFRWFKISKISKVFYMYFYAQVGGGGGI